MQTLTLFVSSPGDVRDERQLVGRVVERLQARYWNFVRLEPVLWEKEPLRATAHFNEELVRPSDCDLFVCVLWSRLGSPLPSQFRREDGSRFDSGTEWELEEATEAFEKRMRAGEEPLRPDLLVYRRMGVVTGEEDEARREQREKLDAFCRRFFFYEDGTIRRAFSPYESLEEFGRLLEMHLEKLILKHIGLQRGLAAEVIRPLPLEGSPFKGLGTFDYEDAPLFFGRNRPIAEALEQLKRNREAGHAFLLIYGSSGYGKSSLMRAGMAPRLTAEGYVAEVEEWRRLLMLPGDGEAGLIEKLARVIFDQVPELGDIGWDVAKLWKSWEKPEGVASGVAALVQALDGLRGEGRAALLVQVDQLEEVFTSAGIGEAERDGFFNVLAALAMSGRVWVLATMRSEFFTRVPECRDLFALVRHGGGWILSPPELVELHQIIRYPALAAGLRFERHEETARDLSEQIYQDAVEAKDALPLLEFTLEELYQRRDGQMLTWAAYEELGGLAGAVARRAQEEFDGLEWETRREAGRAIFGELVTVEGMDGGPATRKRAKRRLLEDAYPGAEAFLECFVDAKLLVTSEEGGEATVTWAHEALITHWPVLREWVEEHRELLLARRRLEEAVGLWTGGGKQVKFLLVEGRLAEAERVVSSGVFRLSVDETELVRLSRERARRKLRWLQTATAVFAVLAVTAVSLGVVARERQKRADAAELATRQSLAAADFDAAAGLIEGGEPDKAIPLLLASLKNHPENADAQVLLWSTLRRTGWSMPEGSLMHPQAVTRLAMGDGESEVWAGLQRQGSGEGFQAVLNWDLEKRVLLGVSTLGEGMQSQSLSVAPGQKRVWLERGRGAPDETLLLDKEMGGVVQVVNPYLGAPVTVQAWSPEGVLFAYPMDADGGLVWVVADAKTGAEVRRSRVLKDRDPLSVQLDRERLRAVHSDGSLLEMPLVIDQAERMLEDPSIGNVSAAQLSTDGESVLMQVATRMNEPSLRFLDIRDIGEGRLNYGPGGTLKYLAWLDGDVLRQRHPWSVDGGVVWDKLLKAGRAGESLGTTFSRTFVPVPLAVDGELVRLADVSGHRLLPVAPLRMGSRVTAYAERGSLQLVGTLDGELAWFRRLPRLDGRVVGVAEVEGEESDWKYFKRLSDQTFVEVKERRMRVREGDQVVELERYDEWTGGWGLQMDVAAGADPQILVASGYGWGSSGDVGAGLVLIEKESGRVVSMLESYDGVRRVEFLPDGKRLVALGAGGVRLYQLEDRKFHLIHEMPVVDGLDIYPLRSGLEVAVATRRGVEVFELESGMKKVQWSWLQPWEEEVRDGGLAPWAEDPERGWLAYRGEGGMYVWSLKSLRTLVAGVAVGEGVQPYNFVDRDGWHGIEVEGGREWLPLMRFDRLGEEEWRALEEWAAGVCGWRMVGSERDRVRIGRDQRLGWLKRHRSWMERWFAGVDLTAWDQMLGGMNEVGHGEVDWSILYKRMIEMPGVSADRLFDWMSGRVDDLRVRNFLGASLAEADADLAALWKEVGVQAMVESGDVRRMAEALEESAERRLLREDGWLAMRTRPERLWHWYAQVDGLPGGMSESALKEAKEEDFRKWLEEWSEMDPEDWRVRLMKEAIRRPEAMGRLERGVENAKKVLSEEPNPRRAIELAELLAWSGRGDEAEDFLKVGLVEGCALTGEDAIRLLEYRWDQGRENLIHDAVRRENSPWLWMRWLDVSLERGRALGQVVEEIMSAVGGEGPAAVWAMGTAIANGDVGAMMKSLEGAKGLPRTVMRYVQTEILWVSGKKASAYELWPEVLGWPEGTERLENWGGWARVIPPEGERVFDRMQEEMDRLIPEGVENLPQDALELKVWGERLLLPETVSTYGFKRVKEQMVDAAAAMAEVPERSELVRRLAEQARLAGADPQACARVEARERMTAGDYGAAYAKWLILLEGPAERLIAADYFGAADCLFEEGQAEAALEWLSRARVRYAGDVPLLNQIAWMLLLRDMPEDAGVVLESVLAKNIVDANREVTLALLAVAAEKTGRMERGVDAYRGLLDLNEDWNEEGLNALDWPPILKDVLLKVAARFRGEAVEAEGGASDADEALPEVDLPEVDLELPRK